MAKFRDRRDDNSSGFEEKTVKINRVATVVKGGRRFSFNALVVVGDGKGKVGFGFGKANEVPMAIDKARKEAKVNMIQVPLLDGTVPHNYLGHFGAAKLLIIPAHPGTGIVAGPAVRAVLSVCGVKNILTKSLGSNNSMNLVRATFEALKAMRRKEEVEKLRGVTLDVDRYSLSEHEQKATTTPAS